MKYLLLALLLTGCVSVTRKDGTTKWQLGKPDKPEPYSNTNPMIIKPK